MVELLEAISGWQLDREQLVIMGNFNNDTTQRAFKHHFQEVELVDAMAYLHSQPTLLMYNRGSYPIDAIYISPGMLQGAKGGYMAFEEGLLSNHQGLWLDLQTKVLFRNRERFSQTTNTQQLQCQDPRVVDQYNQRLVDKIRKQRLDDQVGQLQADSQLVTMAAVDCIDHKLTQAKLEAERHCCKLKAGSIEWCPVLSQDIQAIQYWKGRAKQLAGGNISNNVLQKQAKQAKIKHKTHGPAPTMEGVQK